MSLLHRLRKSEIIKTSRLLFQGLKYGQPEIEPTEFAIFSEKKIIYLVVSKSACTSIRTNLAKSIDIKVRPEDQFDIHSHPQLLKSYRYIEDNYQTYFKFTFVRNPFYRLVSCYEDKVLNKGSGGGINKYYFDNYLFDIPPNSSFREFVKIISKIPDYLSDRHFKSQYSTIFTNHGVKLNFIGKIEHLNEDWGKLSKEFHLGEELVHENKTGNNKDYFKYYDHELIRIVSNRYKKDLVFFDYFNEENELIELISSND